MLGLIRDCWAKNEGGGCAFLGRERGFEKEVKKTCKISIFPLTIGSRAGIDSVTASVFCCKRVVFRTHL